MKEANKKTSLMLLGLFVSFLKFSIPLNGYISKEHEEILCEDFRYQYG